MCRVGSLPSEKMTLSMASENSREIEIVTANFYLTVSPSRQNFMTKKDGVVENF